MKISVNTVPSEYHAVWRKIPGTNIRYVAEWRDEFWNKVFTELR